MIMWSAAVRRGEILMRNKGAFGLVMLREVHQVARGVPVGLCRSYCGSMIFYACSEKENSEPVKKKHSVEGLLFSFEL